MLSRRMESVRRRVFRRGLVGGCGMRVVWEGGKIFEASERRWDWIVVGLEEEEEEEEEEKMSKRALLPVMSVV